MPQEYKEGDFSIIKCGLTRTCYEDAWETIHKDVGYIEYLKHKNKDVPWMFIEDKNALKIMNNLKMKDYHSGASMALTMRLMETIIKYGWDTFIESEIRASI